MLVQIDRTGGLTKKDAIFQATTFKELGLKESDVEEFVRNNIQLLFSSGNAQEAASESLLIVGQQVSNSRNGRTDLVAIDASGYLTLVEIKRDIDDITQRKEPFEFQAIRYAANLATVRTPEQLVELVYAPYIEKHRPEADFNGFDGLTASEIARRKLDDFLSSNNAFATFNQKQRIVLIASEFDPQTLSAVAWLIANQVDISCFTLTPGKLLEKDFLNIEKTLPPPLLEDNYVGFREVVTSGPRRAVAGTGRQSLPKIVDLWDKEYLKKEDRLTIRGEDNSQAVIVDATQVRYNDKNLSYNEWGQQVKGWSSINIYDWAIHQESEKLLSQLRDEMLKQQSLTDDDKDNIVEPNSKQVDSERA